MVDCRGPANEARLPLLSSGGPAGATTGLQRAVAARQQTWPPQLPLLPCQGARQPCPPPVLSPACAPGTRPAAARPHTPQASFPAQGRTATTALHACVQASSGRYGARRGGKLRYFSGRAAALLQRLRRTASANEMPRAGGPVITSSWPSWCAASRATPNRGRDARRSAPDGGASSRGRSRGGRAEDQAVAVSKFSGDGCGARGCEA